MAFWTLVNLKRIDPESGLSNEELLIPFARHRLEAVDQMVTSPALSHRHQGGALEVGTRTYVSVKSLSWHCFLTKVPMGLHPSAVVGAQSWSDPSKKLMDIR